MADANDRNLQGAVLRGFQDLGLPGSERLVIQVQRHGLDCVARVRYPHLYAPTKTNRLQPFTEHRYNAGYLASNEKLVEWAMQTVPEDSLSVLWSELRRVGREWPSGWPLPNCRLVTVASNGRPGMRPRPSGPIRVA